MTGSGGRFASGSEAHGAASVAVVFAVLLAAVVLVAGAALFLASDPAEAPEPPISPASDASSPDTSLSDEEAIERFRELDALRVRAYEERNLDLLPQVFASQGAALPLARSEIRRLTDDRVVSVTRFKNIRLDVVRNTAALIELRQVRVIHPRFLSEAGEDITSASSAQRQVVKWVLRPSSGEWLIYDSVVIQAREVE